MHKVLGVTETGLTFDVALHLGTLLALVLFFYKDIWQLAQALLRKTEQTRLAWFLAAATLPAVIAGVLLQDLAETSFRSTRLVAVNLIVVGIVMIIAERQLAKRPKPTQLPHTSLGQAMTMGVAQAVALIPGVSRSGSTISAGLFVGLSREAAARFSFLLAIPITFGAILKVVLSDNALEGIGHEAGIFTAGILTAFISGFLAIRFLLKFLARHPLNIFAYYRIILGVVVLVGASLL